MEEAGYLSQRLLEIISPDVEGALNNVTIELEVSCVTINILHSFLFPFTVQL